LFGPFFGNLDDDGERLTLENDAYELDESRGEWDGGDFDDWDRPGYPGCVLQTLRYWNRDPWPAQAAGTGHSLSLKDPCRPVADPENWAPSIALGGSPGEPNGFETGYTETPILPQGEVWKYFRGLSAPSDPITAWLQLDFDDGLVNGWLEGQAGFGYGNNVANTVLDMRNLYISVYTRKVFQVADVDEIESLILKIYYDDGFVAYLNGQEVTRANMDGDPPAFDAKSSRSHEGWEEFDLTKSKGLLVPGANILAIQTHNATISSTDFTIDAYLVNRSTIGGAGGMGPVVFNEIAPDNPLTAPEEDAFIEFYNRTGAAIDLSGYWLSDAGTMLRLWELPAGSLVPARGFLTLRRSALPDAFALFENLERFGWFGLDPDENLYDEVSLFLTVPDGSRVAAAATVAAHFPPGGHRPAGMEPTHAYGRFPDGKGPWFEVSGRTPDAANDVDTVTDLVINEIMYHPFQMEDPFSPIDEETNPRGEDFEYLELYNRGGAPIPLAGMHFVDGIEYAFPDAAVLDPGAYLVVARNPARIREEYGLADVHGPYVSYDPNDVATGLSNDGERIALADARGNIVDEVTYYDSDPWDKWADGLGSSLELIDPRSDNGPATAWKASDESGKSQWVEISYQGRPAGGDSEFHMYLLGKGEMLIDDIQMLYQGTNYIRNGTFNTNTTTWVIEGTHRESHWTSEDATQGPCLKIVAVGRGDSRHNRIETDTSPTLVTSRTYEIKYKARWLRGLNWFLTRTYMQGAAKSHAIPVPPRLGTPGARNSMYRANQGPVMDRLQQSPILPGTGAEVNVTVRASDADGVETVRLLHRDDAASVWQTVAMADDGLHGDGDAGDGLFGGYIPAYDSGRQVQFYCEAQDGLGAVEVFPRGAPDAPAIYQVGINTNPGVLAAFRVILSDAGDRYLATRPAMSNDLIDGTFIFQGSQIFYNIGFRNRGSPWIRPGNRNAGFRVRFPADEPLYGLWREINLDSTVNDATLHHDWAYYQMLRTLSRHRPYLRAPYCLSEWVTFEYRGSSRGFYEHRQKIGGDFVQMWYPDDNRGILHKVDDWFEAAGDGNPSMVATANMAYRGEDKDGQSSQAYRHFFSLRTNEKRDDYDPLIRTCYFMDQGRTNNAAFDAAAESMIDINEWLACLSCSFYIADWDTLGIRDRGKNAYIYFPPIEGRVKYLPWDKDLTFSDTSFGILPGGQFPHIGRMCSRPWVQRRLYGIYLYLAARAGGFYGPGTPEFMTPWLNENYATISKVGAGNPSGMIGFYTTRANTIRSLGTIPKRAFSFTSPNGGDDFVTTDETVVLKGDAPIDADLIIMKNSAHPGRAEIVYDCGGDPASPGRLTWTSNTRWEIALARETDVAWGENRVTFECFRRWGEVDLGAPFDGGTIGITVPPVPVPAIAALVPPSIPETGDLEIRITGADLPEAATSAGVFLGGTRIDDANVTYVSTEEIRFIAPPHAPGTLDVCVRIRAEVDGQPVEVPGCYSGLEYTEVPGPVVMTASPAAASEIGGTEITVGGENFHPGVKVFFGAMESPSVTRTSETSLTAILPAWRAGGDRIVSVCAENPDGKRGCVEALFFYMDAGGPAISSIEPSSGAAGTRVTILGSNFAVTGVDVLFGTALATVVEAAPSNDRIVVEAPAGTGRVDVIVVNPSGKAVTAVGGFSYGPRTFVRGDVDMDGAFTIADAISLLDYAFGGKSIPCVDAADVDDDGQITMGDAIRLLSFLFADGQAPAAPFPGAGEDPTPDALDC
ncbi:MAG: lamin tail domain-containing protein, partial [Planctomycetes bacterium]|nr:lamin tail domain-containing protein [Planctomycetota bacterium]